MLIFTRITQTILSAIHRRFSKYTVHKKRSESFRFFRLAYTLKICILFILRNRLLDAFHHSIPHRIKCRGYTRTFRTPFSFYVYVRKEQEILAPFCFSTEISDHKQNALNLCSLRNDQ